MKIKKFDTSRIQEKWFDFKQGCQIFLGRTYQIGENIPNKCTKMYRMAIKYTI
jgi:hypothetical protein